MRYFEGPIRSQMRSYKGSKISFRDLRKVSWESNEDKLYGVICDFKEIILCHNEAIFGPHEATMGNNESLFQDPLSALKGTMRSIEGSLRIFWGKLGHLWAKYVTGRVNESILRPDNLIFGPKKITYEPNEVLLVCFGSPLHLICSGCLIGT